MPGARCDNTNQPCVCDVIVSAWFGLMDCMHAACRWEERAERMCALRVCVREREVKGQDRGDAFYLKRRKAIPKCTGFHFVYFYLKKEEKEILAHSLHYCSFTSV